jgi:hypothetical protein
MSEGMLQRVSSNRKKTSKLYSLNNEQVEDIENPTDDEPCSE